MIHTLLSYQRTCTKIKLSKEQRACFLHAGNINIRRNRRKLAKNIRLSRFDELLETIAPGRNFTFATQPHNNRRQNSALPT